MRIVHTAAAVVAVALLTAPAGASQAQGAPPPVAKVRAGLAVVGQAARSAASGSPDAVQVHYEVARDFEEDLRSSTPTSPACRDLRRHALVYAAANVLQTEGFDKLRPSLMEAGRRRASAAQARVETALDRCARSRPSPGVPVTELGLLGPRVGEVSFGSVRIEAAAPGGADFAVVSARGEPAACSLGAPGRTELTGSRDLRVDLELAPGRHHIAVRFCSAGLRTVGVAAAPGRWVLPESARASSPGTTVDRPASKRLARVAAGFDGYSAVWYHDLSRGRTASWNANARFPAASTVKLGVLVAALRSLGRGAPEGRYGYDLRTMITWSSNLATNRLLRRLGRGSSEAGSRVAHAVLQELGARSSSFTGEYRAGTSVARPGAEPPLVSARVTTARDLGRILFLLHAAAAGSRSALAALELDRQRAQLALSLLLDSEPLGDNVGLVRGSVPRSTPVAQKHGWISSARHSAAVVYREQGPELVVVLTYRSRLSLTEAAAYASDALRVVLR